MEKSESIALKFSTKMKFFWGIAAFGTSIIRGIYSSLLPIFYVDYLGLVETAFLIYIVSLVYAIWNAINDPVFGILSDRSRFKGGRRIPLMRYTAPFLALTFILVWFAPAGAGEIALFWWMLIITLLYDTAYTLIGLAYSALLPEVTEDERERNVLQVFASLFTLLGLILGFLIPDLFRHQSDLLPLQIAMIIVGIIGMSCIIFTTFKFKERQEFTKVDKPVGFFTAIKYTFRRKSFIVLVSGTFMSILVQGLLLGSMFYLADYILQTSTIFALVAIFLPLILGIWITPKLSKKFGIVRSDQILLLIGGFGLVLLTFVPPIMIYICLALAGFGLVGPQVFTNVMYAQVSDEDELKTGVRREANFFGMNAFVTKPAESLALVIPVTLLAASSFIPRALTGGVARPDLQPVEALFAIRVFIGLIPGIALFLEALILQIYPLKGQYWVKVQKEILVLHEEKQKKLKQLDKGNIG